MTIYRKTNFGILILILLICFGMLSNDAFASMQDRSSKIELMRENYIRGPEVSVAPATPNSGWWDLYTDTNGKFLYMRDDGKIINIAKLITDTVAVTNAQIKALRATPKVLIATPGAGKYIVLLRAELILNYGSNVLTESADNMVIRYTTSGTAATAAIEATGFIDAAADAIYIATGASNLGVATNIVNKSVELFNTGDGEYAGNAGADTTMRVIVTYYIQETGL